MPLFRRGSDWTTGAESARSDVSRDSYFGSEDGKEDNHRPSMDSTTSTLVRRASSDLESGRRRSSASFEKPGDSSGGASPDPGKKLSYRVKVKRMRKRGRRVEPDSTEFKTRIEFIMTFAKVLLCFGAPSHRIESQLANSAEMLNLEIGFVHLPNLIIVTFLDSETRLYRTKFIRAGGRVSLTALHKIHLLYRDVLRGKVPVTTATRRLRAVMKARPIYPIWLRCVFAFICASIICSTAFGGAIVDMFISGASASTLQYLGLRAASRSSIYANVYEISVSIIVSFLARALGSLRANLFCFSAISSAGVVLILPGFTVLISALELTSKNIVCGSVRMVYAIIYTLFLGFGLTIGSELYLAINKHAVRNMALIALEESENAHGSVLAFNETPDINMVPWRGSFSFLDVHGSGSHIIKGCFRNPSWPWWRLPLPWWSLFILVPVYSTCSSLANLQDWRSVQLPIMVLFSCMAYAANRGANQLLSDRGDIVSSFGALVIGLCGNVYSRVIGGTAFTSMVTGVLFLVPSALGNGGGLIQATSSSTQEYSSGFSLGVRMIQVAIGVTVGLLIAQIVVYTLGRRKNAAFFAF